MCVYRGVGGKECRARLPPPNPLGSLIVHLFPKAAFRPTPLVSSMRSVQRLMGCKSAVLTALCISWGPASKMGFPAGPCAGNSEEGCRLPDPLREMKEGSGLAKARRPISCSQGFPQCFIVSSSQGRLLASFLLQVHQSRPRPTSGLQGLRLRMPKHCVCFPMWGLRPTPSGASHSAGGRQSHFCLLYGGSGVSVQGEEGRPRANESWGRERDPAPPVRPGSTRTFSFFCLAASSADRRDL